MINQPLSLCSNGIEATHLYIWLTMPTTMLNSSTKLALLLGHSIMPSIVTYHMLLE